MSNFYLLQTAGGAAGNGSLLSMLLPFALIFIVMYFLIIRPNNKRQKETQRMLDAMKKGDKVVTIGGIHGTIHQTKEKTVIVKVDDNTKIEFLRSAISSVNPNETKPAEKLEKAIVSESKKEEAVESVAETEEKSTKRGRKTKEVLPE
ncbi:MAG: preprotein translocase subunit YajC [Treponema sp.]|nr:preprotein translocase subunit YajC [Treponema sp.]